MKAEPVKGRTVIQYGDTGDSCSCLGQTSPFLPCPVITISGVPCRRQLTTGTTDALQKSTRHLEAMTMPNNGSACKERCNLCNFNVLTASMVHRPRSLRRGTAPGFLAALGADGARNGGSGRGAHNTPLGLRLVSLALHNGPAWTEGTEREGHDKARDRERRLKHLLAAARLPRWGKAPRLPHSS